MATVFAFANKFLSFGLFIDSHLIHTVLAQSVRIKRIIPTSGFQVGDSNCSLLSIEILCFFFVYRLFQSHSYALARQNSANKHILTKCLLFIVAVFFSFLLHSSVVVKGQLPVISSMFSGKFNLSCLVSSFTSTIPTCFSPIRYKMQMHNSEKL